MIFGLITATNKLYTLDTRSGGIMHGTNDTKGKDPQSIQARFKMGHFQVFTRMFIFFSIFQVFGLMLTLIWV